MGRLITKSLIVLCTSSYAAIFLSGCADMSGLFGGGQPTDRQAEAPVLLPSYAKGTWYAFNDGSHEVVVESAGDTVVWQDEKGRLETRYRNPVLPRLQWPRGETKVLAKPDALWPLMPGNTVQFQELRNEFDLTRRLTQSKARVWRCSVQDVAVLDTEAGSFETYPISCELRSRGSANRLLGTRIWHYAPKVGHYVRQEKIDSVGTRKIRELTARG
ncbi:MAG: hypothetical protein OEU92_06685 [Alphaproteobacteria bacterium]|nr:hypothetical protein [Alphaproteobacteria bacterium]